VTTELPDTLTLKEACTVSGKSERTLRRWIASGALADLRPAGVPNAPCRVRTGELRALLAALPEPLPGDAGALTRPDTPGGAPAAAGGDARAFALALDLVEELRGDKVRLLADLDAGRLELARERREVERLRLELAEARQAREQVERAAAGGEQRTRTPIRALLAAVNRGNPGEILAAIRGETSTPTKGN
jgi:hypothetical protein